jgi:hypothetical protein
MSKRHRHDFLGGARDRQLAASKMPSHGNSKYFPTQSQQEFKSKKKKKKPLSQDVCKAAVYCLRAIAIESNCCNSIMQKLQDYSTYIVKLSHKSLTMLAAPVRTLCAFTAHIRTLISTKILQASHRHYKMSAPVWHHTRTTSPPNPQP